MVITEQLIRTLLDAIDHGLTAGLGRPEPGKMCVEAAISYALGEPHGDGPSCVDASVRAGKITLNDCYWSSDTARASGMRQVAIAQLGSHGIIDPCTYVRLLAQYTIDEIVPFAAEFAAASAKFAAASAKYAAKSAIDTDIPLRLSAQLMVRALQECGSPGCEWLWMCDNQYRRRAYASHIE